MSTTFFGEISQLHTRAVWYSDEEDEEELENEHHVASFGPHEGHSSSISIKLTRKLDPTKEFQFKTCIVSVSSAAKFQNNKLTQNPLLYFGSLDKFGKLFVFPLPSSESPPESVLWIDLDASHKYISGHQVGYFVEHLIETILSICDNSVEIIILSKEYSNCRYIEYLTNCDDNRIGGSSTSLLNALVRVAVPAMPPKIFRSNFESSLFEQLSLISRPVHMICLPNPVDFIFDRATVWPKIPDQIIQHKLGDNCLNDNYIYT